MQITKIAGDKPLKELMAHVVFLYVEKGDDMCRQVSGTLLLEIARSNTAVTKAHIKVTIVSLYFYSRSFSSLLIEILQAHMYVRVCSRVRTLCVKKANKTINEAQKTLICTWHKDAHSSIEWFIILLMCQFEVYMAYMQHQAWI